VPEKTTGKAIEGIPALDGGLPETGAKAVRASGGKKLTAGDADVGAATLDRRDAQAEISDVKQLDLGNFRPRSPADLSLAAADPSRRGKAAPAEPEASIDDMIKRLAHDIESGRKSNETKSSSGRSEDGAPPPLPGPSERANSTKSPGLAAVSPDDVAAAIGLEPVAAVPDERSASENSRTGGDLGGVDLIGKEMPSPKSAATSKLAAIADALSDEQLEVYLETINGLEDYRAQHYEVSVRLSLADGRKLENAAYIDETRGTGLLPLLEAVKVSSTKRLAIQMIRRGRSGEFFSTVDGEALSDQQFGEDVETITGGDQALASRLVLAFSQADIRNLTAAERRTLESIAALGFRFSVQDITDLDMDFEALAAQGFTFAKLDADVFLKGLPIGPGKVSSADICSHLDGAGLAVIVDKIADEKARAKILGFGAVLGQGAVFGAPRPVRADVLRPTEPPTATL
jgi:cyclic-di-GMP phosphodiesterase TipF (flagellum assembly factor)